MNSKYWLYLFFTDLLAELTATALRWNDLRLFTKPLLIVFLFIWCMLSSVKFLPLRYCIAAALFFSWAGDVFLLREAKGAGWFIAGLGSFLLAHIMYIIFFLCVRRKQSMPRPWNTYVITGIAFYSVSLFGFLYPYIGNLKLPVGIYAITIAAMLICAAHAFTKNTKNAARYCITGAALFVVSDSLLALNKFYYSFTGAGVCIMLTYGLAQFAIVKGSLLYLAAENTSLAQNRDEKHL
ncbi:MAG: lysoplasmalogenase [Chitinophagaceae bacterium]